MPGRLSEFDLYSSLPVRLVCEPLKAHKNNIADQENEDQRLDQLEMPWIEAQTNANKKN
jgi:hypothetical protein